MVSQAHLSQHIQVVVYAPKNAKALVLGLKYVHKEPNSVAGNAACIVHATTGDIPEDGGLTVEHFPPFFLPGGCASQDEMSPSPQTHEGAVTANSARMPYNRPAAAGCTSTAGGDPAN